MNREDVETNLETLWLKLVAAQGNLMGAEQQLSITRAQITTLQAQYADAITTGAATEEQVQNIVTAIGTAEFNVDVFSNYAASWRQAVLDAGNEYNRAPRW